MAEVAAAAASMTAMATMGHGSIERGEGERRNSAGGSRDPRHRRHQREGHDGDDGGAPRQTRPTRAGVPPAQHRRPRHDHCHRGIRLPVTVYSFDRRARKYRLVDCLQCTVPCVPPPGVLNCSAGLGMLGENMELLKAAMRCPAIVLHNGNHTRILGASGDEIAALPPTQRIRVIRAYEMACLNLAAPISHYRLRADGALVLVDSGEVHCVMCHVPETLGIGGNAVRAHLESRANSIRKVLRDRRIAVELGDGGRVCVYSAETLQRKHAISRTMQEEAAPGKRKGSADDGASVAAG